MVYGVIGYIDSKESIQQLVSNLRTSYDFLKRMDGLVCVLNYHTNNNQTSELQKLLVQQITDILLPIFNISDIHIIHYPENRGHNFGTCDLDNRLVEYCKEHNLGWLVKTSMDVYVKNSKFPWNRISNYMEDYDFFYFNGYSYVDLTKNNFSYDFMHKKYFSPQTNFYIINTDKIEGDLIDKEYLQWSYEVLSNIPEFNGKPWEYIRGWSCEHFLDICTKKNNLRKQPILNFIEEANLLQYVSISKYPDPSHKNIEVKGVCHYHYPNNKILWVVN